MGELVIIGPALVGVCAIGLMDNDDPGVPLTGVLCGNGGGGFDLDSSKQQQKVETKTSHLVHKCSRQ